MTARRRRLQGAGDSLRLYLAVAAGTTIGGVLRALVAVAIGPLDAPFPWATLTVNVLGSFVIGFFATLTAPEGRLFISARRRQFVMAGVCGGFTTFSVFTLETLRFAAAGRLALAGANVGVSVCTWLLAVWAGTALATRLNRPGGR